MHASLHLHTKLVKTIQKSMAAQQAMMSDMMLKLSKFERGHKPPLLSSPPFTSTTGSFWNRWHLIRLVRHAKLWLVYQSLRYRCFLVIMFYHRSFRLNTSLHSMLCWKIKNSLSRRSTWWAACCSGTISSDLVLPYLIVNHEAHLFKHELKASPWGSRD